MLRALCLCAFMQCAAPPLLPRRPAARMRPLPLRTQVKKAYMKANLLVHPDKVRQRNGTPEQVAIADMVFDTLKEAWLVFQK